MTPAFDPYDVAGGIATDEAALNQSTLQEWQQVIRAAGTF